MIRFQNADQNKDVILSVVYLGKTFLIYLFLSFFIEKKIIHLVPFDALFEIIKIHYKFFIPYLVT